MPAKLCKANLESFGKDVLLPKYKQEEVTPGIVHIGVGNFHRAHQCVFVDDSLSLPGHSSWGYKGVGLMPGDSKMRDVLKEQDMLYTLWQKGVSSEKVRVMACHSDFILAPEDPESAVKAISDASTKIVTMTITEKGYFVDFSTGKLDTASPAVTNDIDALKSGSCNLKTASGFILAAAKRRMSAGTGGFVVLSCDNVQENGHKAQMAVKEMAGAVDAALATWVSANVKFPNSMVDRITPATTDEAKAELKEKHGIEDAWPVICEEFLLWVVEDKFPDGRPSWEKSTSGKCIFVDDVVPYELMKLRLLNAVHQALTYPAGLLGHELVHDALADVRVSKFLKAYMAAAGRTVPKVKGLDKDDWCKTVIERFSNPAIRDTLFRLSEDATNRIAVALAPCLEDDAVRGKPLSRTDTSMVLIPVACWIRALLGDTVGELPKAAKLNRDDKGEALRGPAGKAWEAAGSEGAEEAASAFLEAAFGKKVASARVARLLADLVQLLKSRGVEAVLAMVGVKVPPPIKLKKPTFRKISSIEPEQRGVNVYGKVMSDPEAAGEDVKTVVIGDASGKVTLKVRGEKILPCKVGNIVRVQNARVIMTKGKISVMVDKWSALKEAEHDIGDVNTNNDISAVEYELVEQ
eukprot:TRINITY_DN2892_c0_g1_i4.p1 TRINITY_DN2892_c0_g1~~TRINITY_DN2892_c0_g1_i4.p1  ORF type:complete len:635 (-),score=154.38 TRINITY_DN2892_c0_g1_i4:184-2088(-)